MSDEIGTLTAALAAVSKEVGSLQPDKRNTQQNYNYISADKILEVVGKVLSTNGLSIIPSIVDDSYEIYEYTDGYGKEKSRIDAKCRFIMTIAHISGESINTPWTGYGTDYVTPDKALYKAITSGHKYFLMKLFNVGVGNEDGEHDLPPDARNETSPQAQAKRQRPKPLAKNGNKPSLPMPDEAMKRKYHALGTALYGDEWDDKRPELVKAVTVKRNPKPKKEITSSNDLFLSEMQHLIDGMQSKIDEKE